MIDFLVRLVYGALLLALFLVTFPAPEHIGFAVVAWLVAIFLAGAWIGGRIGEHLGPVKRP